MAEPTHGGPMSKCPVCGRTGLVGKEHEIVGNRAVTVYKCHGCDNSWRVRDDDTTAIEPSSRETRTQAGLRAGERAPDAGGSAATRRIVILSIGRAEQYQPQHHNEVCISITDPRSPPARLSPGFKAVLRLGFSDIAAASPFAWHVLFAPEHAEEILDFIDRWPDAERIVVHCVGGQSRSPAVGMALCELKGWPLERMEDEHPLWNTWVRSELVRVGRERWKKRAAPRVKPANARRRK